MMAKQLFRPDVLFLIGALQAVIPHLILVSSGIYSGNPFEILYGPEIIWGLGYLSFWAGTRVPRRGFLNSHYPPIPVSLNVLKFALVLQSIFCLGEIYAASRVYGGIPLLAFIAGTADVSDFNLAETQSGFGQMGLLLLSLILLTALIFLLILKGRQKRKPVALWCGSALLLNLTGTLINGKRQGVLMTLMFIAACSACAFRSPWSAFESMLPWKATKLRKLFLLAIGSAAILELIGGVGAIRTLGAQNLTGLDNLALYYGFPAMNMEEQCSAARGVGPMALRPFGIFKMMLPAKFSGRDSPLFGEAPPRIEPSSPSGFYELLQWDTGPAGILLFSFCCGWFSQHVYRLAHSNYAALLTYGLIAWALFSAPLYNHFLNLLFLPLPALIFWATAVAVGLTVNLLKADSIVSNSFGIWSHR
jgi:oligosaccharide repeat unit polymerase